MSPLATAGGVRGSGSPHDPIASTTAIAVAFRHIRPFWRNYIQYVDLAARGGDDRAKKYLAVWNQITARERRHHFPEQLCEMAGILPHELVENGLRPIIPYEDRRSVNGHGIRKNGGNPGGAVLWDEL